MMTDSIEKVTNPPQSFKTTFAGVLAGIGALLTFSHSPIVHGIGVLIDAVAFPLVGIFARDNDKRSP